MPSCGSFAIQPHTTRVTAKAPASERLCKCVRERERQNSQLGSVSTDIFLACTQYVYYNVRCRGDFHTPFPSDKWVIVHVFTRQAVSYFRVAIFFPRRHDRPRSLTRTGINFSHNLCERVTSFRRASRPHKMRQTQFSHEFAICILSTHLRTQSTYAYVRGPSFL